MRLPYFLLSPLRSWLMRTVAQRRPPDFQVGPDSHPYLLRWWLIPRNRVLNIYLHQFLNSDDDRALHDHPWLWCSVLLYGGYFEHTPAPGGGTLRTTYFEPQVRFGLPTKAYRIELFPGQCAWTLFITGPRVREWGFHCPQGWVHWRIFTNPENTGDVGRGCE